MDELYNNHYITLDKQRRIVDGFSDAFRQPADTDICINEQGGYQFRLYPDGAENPALFEREIPLYKYEDGEIVRRTAEELEADRAAKPAPEPTADELINALLGVSE